MCSGFFFLWFTSSVAARWIPKGGANPLRHGLRRATSPERGRFCSTYRQMPKSSPFGGAGCERSEQTERVIPRSAALSQKAARHLSFPSTTPPVKMRLERSAERDKREILNNNSAEHGQSAAEGILNPPTRKRQICPPPFLCPQSVVY